MGRRRSPIIRTCQLEGCAERHYSKGFCKKHYHRERRQQRKEETAITKEPGLVSREQQEIADTGC